MAGRLLGKVALITGAGTGIGEATAHKFASGGAGVLAVGLPTDPLDEVVAPIGSRYGTKTWAFAGDVGAAAAVARAVERFGRLDVLCNIAGVFPRVAETQDYGVENFDATLRNNCRTAFLMTKFVLPHLQRSHGVVLFAGSAAGFQGEGRIAPYGGPKGFCPRLRARPRARAEPPRRACQRRLPGSGRHRLDPARDRPAGGGARRRRHCGDADRAALHARGDGECFRLLASDEASAITDALWAADGGATIVRGSPGGQADPFFRI